MRKSVLIIILLLFSFVSAIPRTAVANAGKQKTDLVGKNISAKDKQAVKASYMKIPLSFIKNEGQKDASILFYEQRNGHATVFTNKGISHSLGSGKDVITLAPLNASAFTVEALDRKEGKVNYLIGKDKKNWKTDIPTYGAILYKGIYPGIDMKIYGTNNQLEYDLIVSPGADPNKIRFSYSGAKNLSLTKQGDLAIALNVGSILQKKPVIYQTINNTRKEIEGRFILADATTYRFEIGSYDTNHPLVIDPVLAYSTSLGGAEWNEALSIAVDLSGNAYVTGKTTGVNYPTQSPYQETYGGGKDDAFVTKINSSGSALVYSTYLGGSQGDEANAIAVDSSGNAYVAGYTGSIDFPTTEHAYQKTNSGGGCDAFVTKINPSGSALVYSTYLGEGSVSAIAVDSSGNAYVTGTVVSSIDFPTTEHAYQKAHGGGNEDAFVTKINSSGSALVYSTYLGGSGNFDEALAIAVDSSGNAYVAGGTDSTDFPTQNPYQGTYGGTSDAFVTKFNPSGSALVYSTYLGGGGRDCAQAIAVDSSGNAYVAGNTLSTDFPTQNPYQGTNAGNEDAFVTKINSSGSTLVYSTYLGGSQEDEANAIAVDSSGNAYVTGFTGSSDFPAKSPYQTGFENVFVTKFYELTSKNDFNADDVADVLLRNTTSGEIRLWFMKSDGTASGSKTLLTNAAFTIVGIGDVNSDGITDILLRNAATGEIRLWFMKSDGTASGSKTLLTNAAFTIVGTGDVNSDGITDILLRNASTGQLTLWFMKSDGTHTSKVLLTNTAWTVEGTGDVNGDGRSDILLNNTSTGQHVLWFMNANGTHSSKTLLTNTAWTIVGTGDINADSLSDILWRNASTGQHVLWFMNADGSHSSSKTLMTNTAWTIVGTGDYNADGISDILWRKASTGEVVLWFMNTDGIYSSTKTLLTNTAWTVVP